MARTSKPREKNVVARRGQRRNATLEEGRSRSSTPVAQRLVPRLETRRFSHRKVFCHRRGVTLRASACSSVEERRPSKPRVGGSNPSRRALAPSIDGSFRPGATPNATKTNRSAAIDHGVLCRTRLKSTLAGDCVLTHHDKGSTCTGSAAQHQPKCRRHPVVPPIPIEPVSGDPSGLPAVSTPDEGVPARAVARPRGRARFGASSLWSRWLLPLPPRPGEKGNEIIQPRGREGTGALPAPSLITECRRLSFESQRAWRNW